MEGHGPAGTRGILVVDDDETMLLICRRIFKAKLPDLVITEANSGEHAIEILRGREFDVILTDFRMGPTNGIDVLAFALQERPGSIRILMSGFGDPGMIEKAKERGRIHEFIEKPVSTSEIERALTRHVIDRYLAPARGQ
ncbi:MAG TPA: response regulator [Candidatus Thermoplasmatota archaeon]|nr:response regulator [Candidatus Thermoplasmatota archaeon]